MYLILLWTAKLLQRASRMAGNSGAALPGLFIEKIWPGFLESALKRLPEGVIVVSGTNGKTTTTKMIADSLKDMGERVITNTTGSNMTRGLISLIVSKSTLSGKLPYEVAVLEVDEAYAAQLAQRVPIRGAVVLNVMRDQLDRFGEIDTTARYLAALTAAARKFVVLNADDARVAALKTRKAAKVIYFGASTKVRNLITSEDEWHGEGAARTKASARAEYVLASSTGSEAYIQTPQRPQSLVTNFEGVHNHLNLAAALAVLEILKPGEDVGEVLRRTTPAFGRGEHIATKHSTVVLLLVKNPSSFVQTISASDLESFASTTIVINDAYADSRDVSWLWDVKLAPLHKAKRLFTAGTRGYDMAVRLKYEGLHAEKTWLDLAEAVDELTTIPGRHAVLCTYTAMLKLRKLFVKKGHVEQVV